MESHKLSRVNPKGALVVRGERQRARLDLATAAGLRGDALARLSRTNRQQALR